MVRGTGFSFSFFGARWHGFLDRYRDIFLGLGGYSMEVVETERSRRIGQRSEVFVTKGAFEIRDNGYTRDRSSTRRAE